MHCLQNPFSRAPRAVVANPLNANGKCAKSAKSQLQRRGSEATSEGSGSSSMRFIDQLSEASSTDTLPGIRGDFLDGELLSPGPDSLNSPTIVFSSEDSNKLTSMRSMEENGLSLHLDGHNGHNGHNGLNGYANGALSNGHAKSWRHKLNLSLRSSDSASTSEANSSSPSPASDSSNGLSAKRSRPRRSFDNGHPKTLEACKLSPSRRRLHGSASQLLGRVRKNGLSAYSDDDDDDDLPTCPLEDVETEEFDASSLPSSPAAPSTLGLSAATSAPVPYYPFLSVNGGAMRQESTSTSSPQLTSQSTEDLKSNGLSDVVSLKEEHRASSTETVALKSLLTPDCGMGMGMGKGMGMGMGSLEVTGSLTVARSCPNLERQCFFASGSCSPLSSPGPAGPRYKIIDEGDLQMLYLNHRNTVFSKIASIQWRWLRRWETHHLYLNDTCLTSKTVS